MVRFEAGGSRDVTLDQGGEQGHDEECAEYVQREALKVEVERSLHDVDAEIVVNEDDGGAGGEDDHSPEKEEMKESGGAIALEETVVSGSLAQQALQPLPGAVGAGGGKAARPPLPMAVKTIRENRESHGEEGVHHPDVPNIEEDLACRRHENPSGIPGFMFC